MYIFLNKGLGMSTGKAAAQAAHAGVEAFRISDESMIRHWYCGGHYTKLVMEAQDATHLFTIKEYLEARGFKTSLIIDEGMTEIPAHTATALGVEVVDRDKMHTAATFGSFKLYREPKPTSIFFEEPPTPTKESLWQRFSTASSNVIKGRNRG